MKLAALAMLPLLLSVSVNATAQTRPRAATPAAAATTTATVTVTDLTGTPLSDVRVTLTGGLDRSGSTQTNGTVKFDTLRPGTYRLRFSTDGYVLLERELEWRAGQPAPSLSVALSPAPDPPAPPAAPEPPAAVALPPAGRPMTLAVPDFIERNFISGKEPQKVSNVGCSGLAHTLLWQIREPWTDRQHENADAMLYVIGGEGTLQLNGRETVVRAGSFASVPRGVSYSLTRRGRNPLILLATLAGQLADHPCEP
jgi:mannose-6-phosphate isomerase-like protein (cupin superfamily)